MTEQIDRRAPMAAAAMQYNPDGSVAWDDMWDSFCELAQDGGPPHRDTMLEPDETADPENPHYQAIMAEIIRGIELVSGLRARPATPGWIAVSCDQPGMARWLCDAINEEHVRARCAGSTLFVPAGPDYTLKGEIKNVVTAIAKTTHYWGDHLPSEVKSTLAMQEQLSRLTRRITKLFRRSST
ncbi:MAG: hypothetical protein SH847_14715 [Roseiflexaceae bacterium]|nr:hypothetical protein [Roseiflexaceae bacterium]